MALGILISATQTSAAMPLGILILAEDGATERTAARGGMDSPRATERMPAQMVRAPLPPSPGSDAGSRVARNSTQVDETPHGLPGHNLE